MKTSSRERVVPRRLYEGALAAGWTPKESKATSGYSEEHHPRDREVPRVKRDEGHEEPAQRQVREEDEPKEAPSTAILRSRSGCVFDRESRISQVVWVAG